MSAGVSRNARVQVGNPQRARYKRMQHLRPTGQHIRMELAAGRRAQEMRELNWEERDAYLEIERSDLYASACEMNISDTEDGYAPLGEEHGEISHAGGDHEVFGNVLDELSLGGYRRWHRRRPPHADYRTRRDRTLLRQKAWEPQIDLLVDAYLDAAAGVPQPQASAENAASWTLLCIDTFSSERRVFHGSQETIFLNEILVQHGCIGCAPLAPTVCFTLRTMEEYRQTHRVCPRMSIQSQVRKLCALHKVPYRHYLVNQFSIAYDAYLDIMRRLDARINDALCHNTPNWRMLNSCPACEYRLEGEPALTFSKLIAMDGNNSLRRVDPTATKPSIPLLDSRTRTANIWLSPVEVNRFKNEVKARASDIPTSIPTTTPLQPTQLPPPAPNAKAESQDATMESIEGDDEDWEDLETAGDVTDGAPSVTVCIERWRNAGPEERKSMWCMFAECGIFVALCRHGFILTLCDMVQSGELAKYALAIVNRLLDVYGNDIVIGYDIGCAFEQTLMRSSQLSGKVTEKKLRMVVPSFHGHAHNRGCQLRWHPMYIPGIGLEDFETCERLFSISNSLARGTRHASAFHRYQAIEEFFRFWDEDKYANIGGFLCDNYVQALEIISKEGPLLEQFKCTFELEDSDFEQFLNDERQYLSILKEPRQYDNDMHLVYVEALRQLETTESALDAAAKAFRNRDHVILTMEPGPELRRVLANLSRQVTLTRQKWEGRLQDVVGLEEVLEIGEGARWTPDHPQRQAVTSFLYHKEYHKALDDLERLVVMRLLELTKLNQSELAYDKRTNIAKKLKVRAEAIRNAVKRYNRQAALLDPPREQVDINQILEYSFISDFDLLRLSREDIREKPWAQPSHREAMARYFRIKAAHDEIVRLKIELRRLVTSIVDEEKEMTLAIRSLMQTSKTLALEIEARWALRQVINCELLEQIVRFATKYDFRSAIIPGQRRGRSDSSERELPEVSDNGSEVPQEAGELSEDDEAVQVATVMERWGVGIE